MRARGAWDDAADWLTRPFLPPVLRPRYSNGNFYVINPNPYWSTTRSVTGSVQSDLVVKAGVDLEGKVRCFADRRRWFMCSPRPVNPSLPRVRQVSLDWGFEICSVSMTIAPYLQSACARGPGEALACAHPHGAGPPASLTKTNATP